MTQQNPTQSIIEKKIQQAFEPVHFVIENESSKHAGPAQDSHFKLVIVSDQFAGKRPVARHQLVYKVLADELAGPVHALAMHLFAEQEWQEQEVNASPNCMGANK